MASLSINQKKRIRSLAHKKFRKELGLFPVEGEKMVGELLSPGPGCIPFRVETLVATGDFLGALPAGILGGMEVIEVSGTELRQVSRMQEHNPALALVRQEKHVPDPAGLGRVLSLGLETIQDPGNLGTILRIADWFGIRDILCSRDCVELYNPKVIRSTMGSFLRVRTYFIDLPQIIGEIRSHLGGTTPKPGAGVKDASSGVSSEDPGGSSEDPVGFAVIATGSRGENLYETGLPERGMILLGNESGGLSPSLSDLSDRVVSIPCNDPSAHPESLNVAAAAAVFCAEFRRQSYSK